MCVESGNGESSATECKISTLTELRGLLDFARTCPEKMTRDVMKLSSLLFEEKQTVNVMLTFCSNCLNSGLLDINHEQVRSSQAQKEALCCVYLDFIITGLSYSGVKILLVIVFGSEHFVPKLNNITFICLPDKYMH